MRIHNRAKPTVIRIRFIHLHGHPLGLVTLTHFAERLLVEMSLPTLPTDFGLSQPGIEPRFSACEANAPPTEPLRRLFLKGKDISVFNHCSNFKNSAQVCITPLAQVIHVFPIE